MKKAILAIFFSSTAFAANAQQSVDIARVCSPILFKATIATIEEKTKSQLFRHYVTLVYSRRTEELEKLEKEGFELGFAIEEVPLKALWSKDEQTRKKAENVYKKYVDDTLLKNDFRQYKEVKDNSFATADYLKCVTVMANSPAPLSCFFGAATERDRVTFSAAFRPTFVMDNKRVKTASIVNGFMLPTEAEREKLPPRQRKVLEDALDALDRGIKLKSAPAGATTNLKIKDNKLDTGIHSFDIFRLDPDREVRVNLQWENNLGCNLAAEPIARSSISATMWPAGRDWVATSDVFEYAATSGCGPGGVVPLEFCTASDSRITSIGAVNAYSANCDSRFLSAVMKPGSNNCITATATVSGCGFTKPWKTCKGRGWVKARIPVNRDAPSKSYDPERSVESFSSLEPTWTHLFEYKGQLPEKFEADAWKYSVEIKRQLPAGVETYVLTDQDPEQGDCLAKVSGTKRSGRLVVSCGPQRGIPALLLVSN